ncbi:MAG: hypothetical protein ACOX7H_08100 [Bacillota bacterium]|jgi:hypothetical protein
MKKTDIHEHLVENGYDMGYTTVCNYIRKTYDKKEAFVRQEYDLGETLEFDWGDVKLTITGKLTTLNMGLFTTAKDLTIMHSFTRIKRWNTFGTFLSCG